MEKGYNYVDILMLFEIPVACLVSKENEKLRIQEDRILGKSDNNVNTKNNDIRSTWEYRYIVRVAAQMEKKQGSFDMSYILELFQRYKIDCKKIFIYDFIGDVQDALKVLNK